MIGLAALRDLTNLEGDDVAEAVALWAGLADHDGNLGRGDAAAEQLAKLVELRLDEPLAAVADWWLVVRFGRTSLGPAYSLPAELGEELVPEMLALRDAAQELTVPPLVWLRRYRELTAATLALELLLCPSAKQGTSRAAVWEQIQLSYRPVLHAVERGFEPDCPNLSKADVRGFMREAGVKAGSDWWRKLEREWERVDDAALALQHLAKGLRPLIGGPRVHTVALPMPPWPIAVSATVQLLVTDLIEAGPNVEEATATMLNTAAAGSPADLAWLACLSWAWAAQTRRTVPTLDALWRRVAAVRTQIDWLQRQGLDADDAILLLDDGDLAGAEQAAQAARDERARQDRAKGLREEARRIRRLVAEAPDEDEQPLWDELDLVEADIADGTLEDAAVRLEQLRAELAETVASFRLRRAESALGQLRKLRAEIPRRLTQPVEQALGGDNHLTEEEVDELEELLEQVRSAARVRIHERLRELQRRVGQEAGAVEPADADEIENVIHEAERLLDDGNLVNAEDRLGDARRLLDQRVPQAWEAPQGEEMLVEHLKTYLRQRVGFSTTDVLRLFVALKTKRFVILAGLTGSGKTTIARLFAEAVGATPDNGRFVRVAVRPNWIDEAEVLGYVNPVSNRFEPGWFASLMRRCLEQPDYPVFCLLDEMNLAPVEHYFADYLSAIEESRPSGPAVTINLYSPGAAPANAADWPSAMALPENLFVIGTVNVDESTRALSDRVLDRANLLQLSVDVGRAHHESPTANELVPRRIVRMSDWRQICRAEPDDGHHEFLVEVASVFTHQLRIGLGVRNHVEIERFHANARGVLDDETLLDVVLLQRIVPKIRGFKRDLVPGLRELCDLFAEVGAKRCVAVIEDWLSDAVSDETYLDGTDARIGLVTSL